MEHAFTAQIKQILAAFFGLAAEDVFERSPLLQYVNIKTKSAVRGSKARGSFANLYAIYVLAEDYHTQGFAQRGDYAHYEGARFTDLLARQRELPFGSKLQNHALNSRLNAEFKKYFPQIAYVPIVRDTQTNRYWLNEHLLKLELGGQTYHLVEPMLRMIEAYVAAKRQAFEQFVGALERLKQVVNEEDTAVKTFIHGLLAPEVDARLFEIVSYAILKFYYHDQTVYFGYTPETIQAQSLKLYKTGRTNANNGGIDFVMRPLGRFFQVTETTNVKKYFLDIDKIERYPISFVIKSEHSLGELYARIRTGAEKQYGVLAVVDSIMNCIEELINLPILRQRLDEAMAQGYLRPIVEEMIHQSRVEFHDTDF